MTVFRFACLNITKKPFINFEEKCIFRTVMT